MRCLVLAKQFSAKNIYFAMLNLPNNIGYKVEEAGHHIIWLNSEDAIELISIITKLSINLLVIDHYEIGYDDELGIKNKTGIDIFVLDDTYEKHHCDILLNHNIYADVEKYKTLVSNSCDLRCGPQYTLLRDEFIEQKFSHKSKLKINDKKMIFVAMGGADSAGISIDILQVLVLIPNIRINIVTTRGNKKLTQLIEYIKGKENIYLHIDSKQIAKLIANSDLAIVTPSVMVNEVFYLDVPFVAIKTSDNQKFMMQYLQEHGFYAFDSFLRKDFLQCANNLLIQQ